MENDHNTYKTLNSVNASLKRFFKTMKDQERTLSQVRIRLEQVTRGIISSNDIFEKYWTHLRKELETNPEKLETVKSNLRVF